MNLKLWKERAPMPCLFYPMAKELGISITELLQNGKKQADLLVKTEESLPIGAVIRMTELWCEAAAYGMEYKILETDFPALGAPLFEELEELCSAVPPSAVNQVTEPLLEAVRLAAPRLEKPLIVGVTGPYTLGSVLNGSEEFMINCMMDPEPIQEFLEKATDFLIQYIAAYRDAGADAVMIAEPSAAMVSPDMMEMFSNQYLQKIIEALQTDNFSILYHNCGEVTGHLETIFRLKAHGFHLGSSVDLNCAAKLLGDDCLLFGNLDPRLFLTASPAQLTQETCGLLNRHSSLDNWRLSTGCDLSPAVPMENVRAFLDAAH